MNFNRAIALGLATCVACSGFGCATSSKDIAPNYVSPMQYQSYDCDQIGGEMIRIQSRVNALTGRLDEAATNDKVIMGVGLILFWPALFALGGTKQQEAEYARLKGEYDALQQSAIQKKCSFAISPGAPSSPTPAQPQPQPQPQPTQPAAQVEKTL